MSSEARLRRRRLWRRVTAICGCAAALSALAGCVYGPGYYPGYYRESYYGDRDYGGPYANAPAPRSYYYYNAPYRHYYPPASYYGY